MAKHIHKYKRANIARNYGPDKGKKYIVFKCVDAHCNHYLEKSMVEGKLTRCNRCENVMIMTKAAMELARPHCPECTISKPGTKKLPNLDDLFKDKGIE